MNPGKGSSATQGCLVLENMAGTAQKTVLSLPASGPVQYLVNSVDFRNARDGWLSIGKMVHSNILIHKPGKEKLVHRVRVTNLLYCTTDGGSNCLLLISDYLWQHGILLSTFHEQEQLESLALID